MDIVVLLLLTFLPFTQAWPAIEKEKRSRRSRPTPGEPAGAVESAATVGNAVGSDVEVIRKVATAIADETRSPRKAILSHEGKATYNRETGAIDIITENAHEGPVKETIELKQFKIVSGVELLHSTQQIILSFDNVDAKQAGEIENDIEKVIAFIDSKQEVFIIEADSKLQFRGVEGGPAVMTPNDSLYGKQWSHNNDEVLPLHVNLKRAWQLVEEKNLTTNDTLFGVVDGGFDIKHPDLLKNFAVNKNEIEDGKDTDGNGCVDDIYGCAFKDNDNGTITDDRHGSHVAGIVAAVTNNGVGVAGCSYRNNLKLVLGQILLGRGTVAQATKAMDYMLSRGVKISSHSYGDTKPWPTLKQAISQSLKYDHLSFWAVNNGGGPNRGNMSDPNDPAYHDYPPRYMLPSMVNVANINQTGYLRDSSCYGHTVVHIAAPGTYIFSSYNATAYGLLTGTSMATPLVAGIAGFIKSVFPEFSALQLKRVVLTSNRMLENFRWLTMYPAMPDAARAVEFALCEREVGNAKGKCDITPTSDEVRFWSAADQNDTQLLATVCQASCRLMNCIASHLTTPSCAARYCDVLQGVCEDHRTFINATKEVELPSFKCEACTKKVMYSGVTEFRIKPSPDAKPLTNSTKLNEMAKQLEQALYQSLPLYEVQLEKWEAAQWSFIYRISSNANASIAANIRSQFDDANSSFHKTAFAKSYCAEKGCKVHWLSEAERSEVEKPTEKPSKTRSHQPHLYLVALLLGMNVYVAIM